MSQDPSPPADHVGAVVQSAEIADRVESACRLVALGKRTAQEVAGWAAAVGLNETEFRLLWRLSREARDREGLSQVGAEAGVSQRALAKSLAVSPAQLSACVAQLADRGLLAHQRSRQDRRRQLCTATAVGRQLIISALTRLHRNCLGGAARPAPRGPRPNREAA